MSRLQPISRRSASVVITAHDQEALIAEAVTSALRQTHPSVEVVVVDDGSQDGTPQVLAGFPSVRVLRQAPRGVSAARNAGFASTTGDVVCFLDGDDRLHPRAVERGLAHLERVDADFAVGRCQLIDAAGAALPTRPRPPAQGDLYAALLRQSWIAPPATVLATRAALTAIGPWDESLRAGGEDLDVYLRLARTHHGVDHAEIVCDYRVHRRNRSSAYAACLRDNLAVLEAQRVHCAHDARLELARQAGERYYRAVFGTKTVLSELLGAVQSRRGVGAALASAAWHTVRESLTVLTIVRSASARYGRR